MIKPPFTILILKNSRRPVTIRVTMGFILAVLILVFLIVVFIGFATTFFVFHDTSILSVSALKSSIPEFTPVQPENDIIQPKPDIQRFSVLYNRNNNMELKLGISSLPGNEKAYIWIMVNPDAVTAGETIVYPRNPIFKGLPVDYRNGITYLPTENTDFSITLSEEIAGIASKRFRILVYSSDGRILVDKYFQENEKTRT